MNNTVRLLSYVLNNRIARWTSLFVGNIFLVINHYDLLFGADFSLGKALQIVLCYLVPYCVSISSQLLVKPEAAARKRLFLKA